MNRIVPSLCAAFALLQLSGTAMAQSREFRCDDQTVLKLKVLNTKTIAAGPIEGRMIAFRQSQRALTYVYGQNRLDIAQDQRSVRLTVSGGSPVNCVWDRSGGTTTADASGSPPPQPDSSGDAGDPPAPWTSDQSAGVNFSQVRGSAAKSWGGVVRSGPGMEYQRLASLKEGDPIRLLEDTHVVMNGYTWFRIRYQGNKMGFQWGGIICPVGQPVAGTFETCD